MQQKKQNKKFEWTSRDWAWVVGILLAVIIFILSFRLGDNLEVVNLFSFISSSVSISLALVAIYIALVQSKDNNELSEHLNTTMTLINEKLTSVDEKVNKIDPDVLSKVVRNKLDEFKEEITQSIQKDGEISPEEIEIKYLEKINLMEDEIEEIVNAYNTKEVKRPLPVYFIGDKVKHSKWGIGTVLEVRGTGDDTNIDVQFSEPVGVKRLLSKFAPIKRVD